jgi:peptidoglycan/LPS O-acetylase OafA/YrhL
MKRAWASIPSHESPNSAANHSRHQPELDGIRGIAILAVLLSHSILSLGAFQIHHPHTTAGGALVYVLVPGWGGVDLFFALSGFLITGILLRARTRVTYFRSFYARRVLRIFPIYYLTLIVTLLAGILWPAFGAHLPATVSERFSFFLYLQNWPIFWQSWAGLTSIWAVFWSLAVEEQFYLIWPTLIRFVSVRFMLGLCIVGFLLGTPLRWWLIHHLTGVDTGLLQFPVSRLDGLFIGAGIALYREYRGRIVSLAAAKTSLAAGAFMLLYIAVLHRNELSTPGTHMGTFGITGFALFGGGLIAASQHRLPGLSRFLTLRPLIFAGKYSYGMYVYHLLVYLAFQTLALHLWPATEGEISLIPAVFYTSAAIASTAIVAMLSFHFVEEPFLRMKRFFPSPSAPTTSE